MRFRPSLLPWLLAVCILGVNGFQAYWLVSTYQFTRAQFDQVVHEALVAAVQQQLLKEVWAPQTPRFDLFVTSDHVTQLGPHRQLIQTPTVTVLPRGGTPPAALPATRHLNRIIVDDWSSGTHLRLADLTHAYRQQLQQHGIHSATALLDTFSLRQGPKGAESSPQPPVFTRRRMPPVLLSPAHSTYVQVRPLPATAYLWERLGSLLGGSVLLLLLTSGCFLLVWHTIRAQRKLAEAKNDFINNMTHELQTPLATVTAAVETLEHFGSQADPLKTQLYYRIARTELRHLANVVERVLTSATTEQVRLVLHPEVLQPAKLVAAAVRRQQQSGKGAQFHVEVDPTEIVRADRFHLEGALNNLLDNAIKYSTESVHIHVRSRCTAGGWQLTVQDDGIGIAADYQAAIFDRFFRVPTGNLHPVKGFGLGLYYVRQVVERHGGHITVRSAVGQGSAFTLWLPLAASVNGRTSRPE